MGVCEQGRRLTTKENLVRTYVRTCLLSMLRNERRGILERCRIYNMLIPFACKPANKPTTRQFSTMSLLQLKMHCSM